MSDIQIRDRSSIQDVLQGLNQADLKVISHTHYARAHEYGIPEKNIPARAPVAITLRKMDMGSILSQAMDMVGDGNAKGTTNAVIGVLRSEFKDEVKKTIESGVEPPIKERSFRRRQKNTRDRTPLIDYGNLIDSYDIMRGADVKGDS